ncbi:polymeric immunoglobulin receptor-like protein [Labeo rohita]|nr:polymeric immunoglobulin receptor-like protein [Labeo rohita]
MARSLILFGVLLYTTGVVTYSSWSQYILAVDTGGSVTIPCHYDKKYTQQKKYWLSLNYHFKTYANTTEKNLSVIDHPDQSLFTVTLRNLQNKQTGHYNCVVETGEQPAINIIYKAYLSIQSDPDVFVVSSSVSGHEGGDISVQCLYSSRYQSKLKQWCRYKDQSCYTVGRTDTSQNSSVQISVDDKRRIFTVQMTGLRLTDSGWYFCSAGESLYPVQLIVIKAEPGTVTEKTFKNETGTIKNINKPVIEEPQKNNLQTVWISAVATLLLLLLLAGVFTWRRRRKPKQDKHQIRGRNGSTTTDAIYSKPEDPVIYSTINDENPNDPNKDIIYSTINDVPGSKAVKPSAVQWENLQISDSGYYWCAVEIGDYNIQDAGYYLYLTVQSDPDMSVVSSSVSGHEGGDISVQCLYSSGYQYKHKQWCRYKDQSCYAEGSTDTSQNSSVKISDDWKKSFTVLMTGLRLTDSGWYCCSVGKLQVPVQLTVTKPKRAPSDFETDMRDVILVMFLPAMLVLLLIVTLVAIVTLRLRKNPKRGRIREEEHLNSTRNAMPCENQMTSNSPEDATSSASVDYCSVIYSSVTFAFVISEFRSNLQHCEKNTQSLQWENLQTSDSGYYWCAVEIGDYRTLDDGYCLYLTVQSVPDVSVVSSSVSGHEGGDISVQCLYSSEYQNKVKQWCRYKDQSCYTVGRTDTSQNSSVQISDDDGRRSFTVLMTGLRLTDSGWYCCSVGDLQVPVQLTVTKPKRGVECDFGWSNNVLTVQTGGSVTILCHYDKKYTQQKKYWYSEFDKSSMYTNTTEENLSVTDHPDQSLFTVTMRNLQNKHTGHYYCVVETGEQPPINTTYEPYLRIQSAPDVSVVSSSVSGHEGGDISVQCLYSSEYQNKLKKWCRYKDQSCYTVGRTDTSQNSSVQISDDGRRSFTVLMTGLRLNDSGWYCCSVGEKLNPVQLTVTQAESVQWENLQTSDSGYYWCAVEIGGYNIQDAGYYLYLTVQSVPDVSVVSSSVSGHEGGDIGVQCLYSSGYQNKLKQWCRIKDKRCYTVGRTNTSQNSSVQISDYGRRSFTVLMTGLRLTDSGWYCCSVGDLQVPVQLTVTKPKRVPDVSLEEPQVPVLTVTETKPAPDVSVVNSSVSGHEGGDISVQCLYSSEYQNKLKRWCRYKDQSCYTVGRTDTSQNSSVQISEDDGRRSFTVLMTGLRLTDSGWYFCSVGEALNPVHLSVTQAEPVQWENLQTSDSGYYWCAVEIGGYNIQDAGYYLYLTVQSVPDVSVVSSSVSGHEGGDISVQCLYSSGYQNKLKQWCRIKDKRCYTVGRTNTSQNSSVKISDDGRRSFTVLMTGLRLNDSGWYCCSVGDLQVPVQLSVTKPKRAPTTIPAATPSDSETDMHTTQSSANRNPTTITTESRTKTQMRDVILVMFLPAMLMIVTLVAIVTLRLRKNPKRGQIREEEHLNSTRNAMPCENQMTSNSPEDATSSASVDEGSVTYSSITFHKAPSSSVNSEVEVIYNTVKKTQKAVKKTPKAKDEQMMKQRQCETSSAPPMHMHSAVDMIYPLILLLHITDPAVSVVSSSVSGHEGGDISVQCLYSTEYQKKPKQWCKIKDQSCYTVERTDTSQNSSVHITDDVWKSSFTVLMTGLRLTDSGWYCCSVGDLQVPVQLTVTKPKRALTVIQSATPSDSKTDMHDVILVMFLPAMLVLFVILVAIVRLRKKPERGQTGEEEHLNSTRNAMPCENQMTSNSPADANFSASVDEGSVIYSAVITFHKAPSTSVNSEGEVIYSAVKKTST